MVKPMIEDNDRVELFSKTVVRTIGVLSQDIFMKYIRFMESDYKIIDRELSTLGSLNAVMNISNTISDEDIWNGELALLCRTLVFNVLWGYEKSVTDIAWWRFGVAADFIISLRLGTSLKRWDSEFLKEIELSYGSVNRSTDVEVRQGFLFKDDLLLGPATNFTLKAYRAISRDKTLSPKEVSEMTIKNSIRDERWLPWVEAVRNVP